MKKFLFLVIISCQLLFLTGCWGFKEIQAQTFITGIGLDYGKGQFTVYLQALNFSNVAKQEGGSSLTQPSPIFIAEAKANSIPAAISKLEQKAALPLYYGHIQTILLSKNVIKEKMKSVIEFVGQNPYVRYNCWLFGTEGNIKEILLGESFFNYPSLNTVIHNPSPIPKRNFFMPVIKYNNFISKYYQPVGTNLIPAINMNKKNFSEGGKEKNIAFISGGFVVAQQQFKGFVKKENLIGLKWLSKQATAITLFKKKESVVLIHPKSKITVLKGKKPSYRILVNTDAILFDNQDGRNINTIEKALEKTIKQQIETTINKSDEIKTDLLNLSEKSYRYHLKEWNVKTINSINKESIKDIQVKVHIEENINYKR